MWKNLGIELSIHTNALEIIKLSNSDVEGCCSAMFRKWLERGTTASWRQLIKALRQLQLNHLASQIESKLTIPGLEPSGVNPGNYTINASLALIMCIQYSYIYVPYVVRTYVHIYVHILGHEQMLQHSNVRSFL